VIDNKLSLVLLQKFTDNFAIVEIIGNFFEIYGNYRLKS